jgi:hypothetical protein
MPSDRSWDELEAARYEAAQARADAAAAREEAEEARREAEEARREAEAALAQGTGDRERETGDRERAEVTVHKMHNLHTVGDAISDLSAEPAGVYATKTSENKFFAECMHNLARGPDEEPSMQTAIARPTGKEPGEPPRGSP